MPDENPPDNPPVRAPARNRERKTEVPDLMMAFMDMQKKQHAEFMHDERQRQQEEKAAIDGWMRVYVEMERQRQQERQETNQMFMYTMNRKCDAMAAQRTPSHSHQHSSPHSFSHSPLHSLSVDEEETPPQLIVCLKQ